MSPTHRHKRKRTHRKQLRRHTRTHTHTHTHAHTKLFFKHKLDKVLDARAQLLSLEHCNFRALTLNSEWKQIA